MCILFVNVEKSPKDGQYRIILAANRDEFYGRPAMKAHFWDDDGDIIGGRDMAESKEGGTWLAMSRQGKIGVLLNLAVEKMSADKLGRGFLVVNYLKDGRGRTEHLETLLNNSQQYNKFHLVAIESSKDVGLSHYCNEGRSERITTFADGVFAVSNSLLENPMSKVREGQIAFGDIVEKYNGRERKESLVQSLLELLKRKDKYVDDDAVLDSAPHLSKHFKEESSSVYIDTAHYGTRTHTIILVDDRGRTDFYEWTLKEPIDPEKKEWLETHEEFDIADSTTC